MARSLARPDFPLLLPAINIQADLGVMSNGTCIELPDGAEVGNCVVRYNGYSGNPDLEPMRSWQYDVAAEWYINPTNSLTGAIFYKQLEGFMETSLNSTVEYTNNGQTATVRVLRPENQGNGYVQGFEAAYNGFFDFLPGFWKNFGARAAFTYVESGGTRNIAANPYDAETARQLGAERLSTRRIEQDQLQRGDLLQHAAVRSTPRVQLAREICADHGGGQPGYSGLGRRLRSARRLGNLERAPEPEDRRASGQPDGRAVSDPGR